MLNQWERITHSLLLISLIRWTHDLNGYNKEHASGSLNEWGTDPFLFIQVCVPNGNLFPYIVHYFWSEIYGPGSKVVHYVGNRVPFGTHQLFPVWKRGELEPNNRAPPPPPTSCAMEVEYFLHPSFFLILSSSLLPPRCLFLEHKARTEKNISLWQPCLNYHNHYR